MAICVKCGEEIKFITTSNGKSMPINAHVPVDAKLVAVMTSDGNTMDVLPHWATCPDAAEFRKNQPARMMKKYKSVYRKLYEFHERHINVAETADWDAIIPGMTHFKTQFEIDLMHAVIAELERA